MPHALVVDDDAKGRAMLGEIVAREGFSIAQAESLKHAREAIEKERPNVVLLDLYLPDGNGLELLEELAGSSTAVVLVTGHPEVSSAVEGLRAGVADYLRKPVDLGRLRELLARVAAAAEHDQQVDELRRRLQDEGGLGKIIGASPMMRDVFARLERVAPTDAGVLITGESGTGKELLAHAIHARSKRADGPFHAVNCGAVSTELIESELFGHEKGAFTGAHRKHEGYFERATGGTLFLDEITEMAAPLQVKLLRTLESGEIIRVGGEKTLKTDVRVLAATNRDPEAAVESKRLRSDLYYRLNVFRISTPPLRDRDGDVELLAQHFLTALNENEDASKKLSEGALELLRDYRWPGNVRELRNSLISAFIMADEVIRPEDLPAEVRGEVRAVHASEDDIELPLGSSLAAAERHLILATLDLHDGHRARAAESLGVSLRTLYNRINTYTSEQETPADTDDAAS